MTHQPTAEAAASSSVFFPLFLALFALAPMMANMACARFGHVTQVAREHVSLLCLCERLTYPGRRERERRRASYLLQKGRSFFLGFFLGPSPSPLDQRRRRRSCWSGTQFVALHRRRTERVVRLYVATL